MDERSTAMNSGVALPPQDTQNRHAFLRYLPRRIADFERRIVRYRFAGWDPKGMVVLAGDAHRLADASEKYALADTREHLLAIARMVGGHAAELRSPDLQHTTELFAMLAAVRKSLPAAEAPDPSWPATAPLPDTATADAPEQPGAASVAATDDGIAATTHEPIGGGIVVPAPTAPIPQAEAGADAAALAPRAAEPHVEEHGETAPEAITPVPYIAMNPQSDPSPAPAAEDPGPDALPGADVKATAAPSGDTPAPATPEAESTPTSQAMVSPGCMPTPAISADPVIDAASAPAEPAAAAIPFDESEQVDVADDVGMRRVFHLSDGNANAIELTRLLEEDGYAVEPVADIDELSDLLTCMMPNLLLVDASHAARLAIIGALRRDAQLQSRPPRHIQLVLLAANDGIEMRRAAHRAGVDLLLATTDAATVVERLHVLHADVRSQPIRVLIVDDQRADALFASGILARAGMHVRVEHDPLRVIEALSAEQADLLLMDLHMPVANGVELTMLLREDPRFARIPIVFLSGESDPDSRLEAINAGGDDFLFKPIRPRHLVSAVQDRVQRPHPAGRPATAAAEAVTG